MPQDPYSIRLMTRREIDRTVDWAAAEGWNPGLRDADCFHRADPDGFHVGLLNGEPIASISAVRYGDTFAFVGFYIVRPEHRGNGYGLRLWNAALATLGGRNVGLDGVVDQQANYRKSGFTLAYRNVRYQGIGTGEGKNDPDVIALSSLPFAAVETYDRPFFPAPRGRFLECWVGQPGAMAAGLVDGGRLIGYGVMRACRSGFKIGPLFADDPAGAERLFSHFRAVAPAGAPIFLDIPEVNSAAVALVRRNGMTPAFETARMYTGSAPDLPLDRLFGVTTFELG